MRPVRTSDNLTTFMFRLSWNLGVTASWNLQGLSMPVMRSLFLLLLSAVFPFSFLLNTFLVSLPSTLQVPVPQTRLSLSYTSIISDPFLSDPLPQLSNHTVYIAPSWDEAAVTNASCQALNPSARVEVRAHVNVDQCKWSFASRFVWSGRVDFITERSARADTWEASDTEHRMQ